MKTEECRRFRESLKRRIVKQIEAGSMSISEASREYGASKTSVKSWLEDYGRFRTQRRIVEVVMKDEKEKITELEKALADAHLKLRLYDEIINIANKKYKTDLKKTIGTKELGSSGKKGSK